ncbi:carbohydrate ABC transporter permease [Streptomyces sp. NPDC050560]|uniref:carbohydrate ABC transporter permease n=1 Tax=Streptomyces sp. NPDC050560 TaxID=3365630 RepID=UPI003791D81C
MLVLLFVFVPLVMVVVQSLQHVETGSVAGPYAGFDNFAWVLTDGYFYRALAKSAVWVFGGLILEFLFGLPVALLLHQSFRMRSLARALVLFPYLLPSVVAVITFRFMFQDLLGIVNRVLMALHLIAEPVTWLGDPTRAMLMAVLVSGWKFFPFVVIALLGALQSIPDDLYEAAAVDGAGRLRRFTSVTLPHLMPVLLLVGLLRTIWNFDKFDVVFMLTGGGPGDATTTVPVAIYRTAFQDLDTGRAAAMGITLFAMLMVLAGVYLWLMRRAEEKM